MVALGDDIETVAQHYGAMIVIAHIAGDYENRTYAAMVSKIRIVS